MPYDTIDPSLLQMNQQPNFSWQSRAMNGAQGFLGNRDLALALLANSGPSTQKRSFGQILGGSMLQADQAKQQRQDDEFKRAYMMAQMQAMQNRPGQSPTGQYQPGDYTTQSWAKFAASDFKDPSVLERFITARQEFSPSFQNVTRNLPDGSTQQGTFNTRTGEYNWNGAIVPPGKKAEAEAAGSAKGKISGELEGKGPRAYETFKVGIANLENAMSNTDTGPLMGRIPALTNAQQTAEGAEAIMAPVLKQLFREAGEGTFTDSDQALLLKMVPNRKDGEEARKAKIEMIDQIVRAKLGMKDALPAPPPGIAAPPADAPASNTVNWSDLK